jgi:hypothetical protein
MSTKIVDVVVVMHPSNIVVLLSIQVDVVDAIFVVDHSR